MTSDIIRRYIWLVDTIYQSGEDGISFEEINKKWKRSSLSEGKVYPIKTFHNHRRDIENIFNIIIECRKSTNSYYLYDPEELKKSSITTSWLIDTLAVNNLIADCQYLKDRIAFEYIPSGNQYLTRIIQAMQENKSIDMDYLPFWHNEAYPYKELHPYAIKLFKQRWYMIAYNTHIKALRTFSLDRIKKLEITDNSFVLPDNFDVNAYFHAYFGITTDDTLETTIVSIRVNETQRKYLRSLPLHHSQEEIEIQEHYSIFSYTIKPTHDFIQEILRYGDTMEVIEPLWLRNEIKCMLQKTLDLYL
ncbi:MAG: WYL domain-containing protein [Bacteroidales bacterium]|jgi:hypothetical protein|nr:WYL domain-containing protein [Bacteroidales bacterium]